jgi:hypothetical protein
MSIIRVSGSFNFEKKIRSFCQSPRYHIDELSEDFAMVDIDDPESDDDYPRFVSISSSGDIVRFCMPGPVVIEVEEPVPHSLSTILLKINSFSRDGFWCLEETDDESHVFAYIYNVSKTSLNKKQFDNIIDELIKGNKIMEEMLEKFMAEEGMREEDDDDLEYLVDEDEDSEESKPK